MLTGLVLRYTAPGWAEAAFSQLYPGGHACVFGQTREAIAAEDAGFEVRDCLTVLGPTIHRVWLLRRPCQEATVAAQVLKTETGGLWIDGCRVSTADKLGGGAEKRMTLGDIEPWHRPWMDDPAKQEAYAETMREKVKHAESLGRWPANLLLMHTTGCEAMGMKRVQGSHSIGTNPKFYSENEDRTAYGDYEGHTPSTFVGKDGLETVQAWACQPECVIPKLDTQSGVLTSGEVKSHYMRNNSKNPADGGYSGKLGDTHLMGYGDTGGASRFFPQFAGEDELDTWLTRLVHAYPVHNQIPVLLLKGKGLRS